MPLSLSMQWSWGEGQLSQILTPAAYGCHGVTQGLNASAMHSPLLGKLDSPGLGHRCLLVRVYHTQREVSLADTGAVTGSSIHQQFVWAELLKVSSSDLHGCTLMEGYVLHVLSSLNFFERGSGYWNC